MTNNRWILLGIALAFLLGMYLGSRNINTTPNAYAADISINGGTSGTAVNQQPPIAMAVNGDNVFVLRGGTLTMYTMTVNPVNKSVKDFTFKAQVSVAK